MSEKNTEKIIPNINQLLFPRNGFFKTLNKSLVQNKALDKQSLIMPLKTKKSCLKLKKVDLNESKNKSYSEALQNIFNDPINYLNENYKGKKVIIGKKYKKVKGIQDLYEYYYRQNKRRKTMSNKVEIKFLSAFQKVLRKNRSIKNKFQDVNKKNSSVEESSKITSPKNKVKDVPLSDNELNSLYKAIIEREEKNKQKKVQYCSKKNGMNKTQRLEVNQMLNLQEKILKIKNKRTKLNQKLSNKIINATMKEKDQILMNEQRDVLVIKGKTLDKEFTKFSISNPNIEKKMKNWIFNLRKNKQEIEQSQLISSQEVIYSNKDLTLIPKDNDISIRRQLFKKISINSEKEKEIKEAGKNNNINIKRKYYRNDDNIKNKSMSLKSIHNLFIQGKNLLNQEIKLSKDLLGKKKILMKYSFLPSDISSILVAKSNSVGDISAPKAVVNSMEIHKLV